MKKPTKYGRSFKSDQHTTSSPGFKAGGLPDANWKGGTGNVKESRLNSGSKRKGSGKSMNY